MSISLTEEGAAVAGVVPQRLRPPRSAGDSLPREGLLSRLVGTPALLVVIHAGAGYGKTSLLRQWADECRRPVGWVSIDVADNDPVVMLRHVVVALAACGVEVAGAQRLLNRVEPQVTRLVLPALAAAMEVAERPFVLMLDDVHHLEERDAVATLAEVLDLVPHGSTVVLSGRRVPAVGVARRSLESEVVRLEQTDLAYTADEAVRLVRRELPDLAPASADELLGCTGRWPAAVYLGILALRDHPDPPVVLRGLLASDRRVAEYLHEEVLDRLPEATRTFLIQASVLDRLDVPLCDHVLERDDSAELIRQLDASGNLFVMALEGRTSYRLHDLFADLLLDELRRSEPDSEAGLRRRAAEWHDRHGEADAAVRQAIASGDVQLASRVLYRQLFGVMMTGQTATLGRWVSSFPAEVVRTDGLVALCAGWHALGIGDVRELVLRLDDARALEVEGPLPDGTVSYDVALAALEMTASMEGISGVARTARIVRSAGPAGSPWCGLAAYFEALALSLSGRVDIVDALERSELECRGMPAVHVINLAQLSWAHLRAGDLVRAQRVLDDALRETAAVGLEDFSMAAQVHNVHSLVAAVAGDHAGSVRAAEAGEAGMALLSRVMARGQIHAHLLLAEAALERREPAQAARLLQQAADDLPLEPDARLLHDWHAELMARLGHERRRGGVVDLTAAEQRVLAQLPTHRSLVEIGDHLYVSRNTVKTHTLSIYRKLGVSGRSEAVQRAQELGLLVAAGDAD